MKNLVYYHVGTGRTPSVHYCRVCDGCYGVPHDGPHGPHAKGREHPNVFGHRPDQCAYRPCQEHTGVYPTQGEYRERVTLFRRDRTDER